MLVGLVACDAAPNTAFVPVGSRCSGDRDCGTAPYRCELKLPGGYCEKPCGLDGDCPADAACALGKCRRKCTDTTGCRSVEGYACQDRGGTSLVCDANFLP